METNLEAEYRLISIEISDEIRLNSEDYEELALKGNNRDELYIKAKEENNLNELDDYLNMWKRIISDVQAKPKKEDITHDITLKYEKIDCPIIKKEITVKNSLPTVISVNYKEPLGKDVDDLSITFNYDTIDTTFS